VACRQWNAHNLKDRENGTRLSARNIIKGKVVAIKKGAVAARVKVDIGGCNVITSTVAVDAVEDLKLVVGSAVFAIIEASEATLMVLWRKHH
jgi:molybdopterin-binding protein